MNNRIVLFLTLFLLGAAAFSQTLTGKVVGITDGDTFKLLTADSTLVKVRLANIDCPEKKQPYATKAKEFTANAIFGKTVTISILKTDRYKRYISNVTYNDTMSLCHDLVSAGLAWHFVRYSNDDTLQQLEDRARVKKRGLWQDPYPVAPWDWRTSKKKKKP